MSRTEHMWLETLARAWKVGSTHHPLSTKMEILLHLSSERESEPTMGFGMHRRSFCLGGGAAAASTLLPTLAAAEDWPARPIRMIVPFPAGGGTDAISRQLTERITHATGWSIAIENRAGAGGNIGLESVAKAAPDGYTIGMGQAANR